MFEVIGKNFIFYFSSQIHQWTQVDDIQFIIAESKKDAVDLNNLVWDTSIYEFQYNCCNDIRFMIFETQYVKILCKMIPLLNSNTSELGSIFSLYLFQFPPYLHMQFKSIVIQFIDIYLFQLWNPSIFTNTNSRVKVIAPVIAPIISSSSVEMVLQHCFVTYYATCFICLIII